MKMVLPVCCLTLLSFALLSCSEDAEPPQDAETQHTKTQDKEHAEALPESLPVVQLADIQALVSETADQGRVTVIDFWATWCMPCVAMFPDLHAGLKEIGDEHVRAVSITLDAPGEDENKAIKFLADMGATKDAYLLSPASADQVEVVRTLGEQWNQLVVPAVLVFDQDGELVGEHLDGPKGVPALLDQVRSLVK